MKVLSAPLTPYRCISAALICMCLGLMTPVSVMAQAYSEDVDPKDVGQLPSLTELETLGARIGTIHIQVDSIFDLADPAENWLPFRWANRLHITTRPDVVRSGLLFQSGDRLLVRRLEETERVLRRGRYLYDVQIRPIAWHPTSRLVDLEVRTRDTWTLAPSVSASRSGGVSTQSVSLREMNFMGRGLALNIDHERSVDRSGTEYALSTDRAFGTWVSATLSTRRNTDGQRDFIQIARPFYALDTPWSAGFTLSRDDRVDALYQSGNIRAQYRRLDTDMEVYGGWAMQLQPGWVRRTILGISHHEDRYEAIPGVASPGQFPNDETLIAPFARWEWLQDHFEKTVNLNQMGRAEYIPLGWQLSTQVGRTLPILGASHDLWLYRFLVSRGFELGPRQMLLTSAKLSGRWVHGSAQRQHWNGAIQYYHPVGHRSLSYVALSADALERPNPIERLMLGGDSGLRGYPLRYQSGDRRMLMTLEQRLYTDWYWFQLFRVGGAAFMDVGRAWGGELPYPTHPGWLANVGLGVRIFSVRAAFGTVLHLDWAMPVQPFDGLPRQQFLIRTKTSF